MAVLRCCGFEWGTTSEPDYCTASISTGQKRTGTYSLYTYSSNCRFYFTATDEIYFQTALYPSSFTSDTPIIWFTGAERSENVISVSTSAGANKLKFYVGEVAAPWIPACTTNISLATAHWYLVEVHAKVHSVDGFIEVRVNGLTECTFYGNTKPGTATSFDGVTLLSLNSFAGVMYWDDVIVHDTTGTSNNSWVDGARISLIRPSGAGALTQWTPSTGSNYQCVDEVPPSSTDYVSSDFIDEVDLYTLGDLPSDAATVKYLRSDLWIQRVAGGTTSYVQHAVSPPQGTSYSEVKEVPTSWSLLKEGYETNPQTAADWTVSDVNAMEAGVKSS